MSIINVKRNEIQTIEKHLDKGSDVDRLYTRQKVSLLFEASSLGREEIVEMLLDREADVTIQSKNKDTALIVASKSGHLKIVELLLDYGANPNIQGEFQYTSLIRALQNSHGEIVKVLLEYGADPNIRGEHMGISLIDSVIKNSPEITELLLEYGADVNMGVYSTALIEAAENNKIETAKILLEYGADTNIKFGPKYPALMRSALSNNSEMLDLLLQYGAKPNITNRHNESPLIIAAMYNSKMLDLLLEYGAKPNIVSGFGISPLDNTLIYKNYKHFETLLEYGADLTKLANLEDLLYKYLSSDNETIVKLLLNNGAELSEKLILDLPIPRGKSKIGTMLRIYKEGLQTIKNKRTIDLKKDLTFETKAYYNEEDISIPYVLIRGDRSQFIKNTEYFRFLGEQKWEDSDKIYLEVDPSSSWYYKDAFQHIVNFIEYESIGENTSSQEALDILPSSPYYQFVFNKTFESQIAVKLMRDLGNPDVQDYIKGIDGLELPWDILMEFSSK